MTGDSHPERYQVLHTREGTVLAIAPSATISLEDGTRLGSSFTPAEGQFVTEVELTREQQARPLAQLLEDHEIALDIAAGRLVFTPRQRAD